MKLKAPFPWFGGKSRVAALVWSRFGRVQNYVEPFAGSLANLLGNPASDLPVETVNDVDACLCNFWRATQWAPADVAYFADWPVNEIDLHARHRWCHARMSDGTGLNERQAKRVADDGLGALAVRLEEDADYFDAQLAGWWVWGLSAWIGDNWCRPKEQRALPGMCGHGINRNEFKRPGIGGNKRPALCGNGLGGTGSPNHGRGINSLSMQLPMLSGGVVGRGVASSRFDTIKECEGKKPNLLAGGNGGDGKGVNAMRFHGDGTGLDNRRPHLGENGLHCYRSPLVEYFEALSVRLRRVRVCCGDWARVCTPSVTVSNGLTGVFLDPPYGVTDRDKVYNHDSLHVSAAVRAWAIENGDNRQMRIALCGYADEHVMPETWECVAWKAAGGYGNQRKDKTNVNAGRERIWFSPHCLKADEFLFEEAHA